MLASAQQWMMNHITSDLESRFRQNEPCSKAKGVYKGRPVTLDHPRILAMRADVRGATEIAKALGCSRGAVYKALNGRLS